MSKFKPVPSNDVKPAVPPDHVKPVLPDHVKPVSADDVKPVSADDVKPVPADDVTVAADGTQHCMYIYLLKQQQQPVAKLYVYCFLHCCLLEHSLSL